MDIDVINRVVKEIFIYVWISYVFLKITNNKNYNVNFILKIILIDFFIGIIYDYLSLAYNTIILNLVCITIFSIFFSILSKNKLGYTIIISLMALGIVCGTYIISSMLSSFVFSFIFRISNIDNIYIFTLITIFESIILYLLFRVKRFKNGFSFATNKESINNFRNCWNYV